MTKNGCGTVDAILEISRFNSNPRASDSITARLTHCSAGGIGFISSKTFSKDTPVYIRLKPGNEKVIEGAVPEGFRSAGIGKVKWSKPVASEKGLFYETAVQYFNFS